MPPFKKNTSVPSLKDAQIRILEVLNAALGPMYRKQLLEKSGVKTQGNDVLGALKEGGKDWGFPSLLDLGYVSRTTLDIDGKVERVYSITEAGKSALKKISDD